MPLVGRSSYRPPTPAVATLLLWTITVQGVWAAESTQASSAPSSLPSSAAPSPADGDIVNEELLASIADLDPEAMAASGATAADIRWMLVTHSRQKRNVVQLGEMIRCATGCNPVAYKGYGCYCGFLGSGEVVDGIDNCCYEHDWCYWRATRCFTDPLGVSFYVSQYKWQCSHGNTQCGFSELGKRQKGRWKAPLALHGDKLCNACPNRLKDLTTPWTKDAIKDLTRDSTKPNNFGAGSACARQLCECDRQFAKCLRRYPCPSSRPVCSSSPLRHWQNLFLGMRSARSYRNRLDDSLEAYGDKR